ncbi:cellulose binding domain-containing protein [Sphaerisporangium sp. NPDC049002]|uniref:cellulose binding domain-containing protein n=1 Tax=Sphaerisporangium sp. NPDC049002 TaxID=3155392 RepID=UPI0033CA60A8
MRLKRNPLVLLLTLLVSTATVLLTPGTASAASPTATFVKTSEWGSAFQGAYTVNNGGTTPINGWSVAFDLPSGATVTSSWDASMSRSGQRFTFTGLGWNATIAPGASVTFGFIAAPGSAVPANCTLNGASCGGVTTPTVPGKPGTPAATATASSIALSWAASSGTVTGYRVYEGTTVKSTVTGTTATIGSLGTCESHTYTVRAYNAQGESPAGDPVSATTTGCAGGGPLPKHFLTGYWHNFVNPAVELKLSAVPAEYDLIAVAFAEATSTAGQVSFHLDPELSAAVGGYTEDQFKADIQALHARGKKVILSVGGELGRVQVSSSQAATAFADSAYALMGSYGFDGVDIDLEAPPR